MSAKFWFSVGLAFSGVFHSLDSAIAQTWKPSSAPFGYYWASIACSADGTKLAAAAQVQGAPYNSEPAPGYLFVSTNAGATWTQTAAPANFWTCIACSADGTKLVACETGGSHQPPADGGHVYTSSDSGATWTPASAPAQMWWSVASSADGRILIGAGPYNADGTGPGSVCVSTNSGATWTPVYYGWCASVACSADGGKLFAGPGSYGSVSYIIVSTNLGATWDAISDMAPWRAVACSADGTKLVSVYSLSSSTGSIYTSTNCGATWTEYHPGPYMYLLNNWDSVASSADGTTLVAAEHDGGIWTSTNSGASWEKTEAVVGTGTISSSVAVSANGVRLAMAMNDASPTWQGIWTGINPPWLNIAAAGPPSDQSAVLSWPTNAGATLQQSSRPDFASCSPATNAISIAGDRCRVTVPLSAGNCFYRLVCP